MSTLTILLITGDCDGCVPLRFAFLRAVPQVQLATAHGTAEGSAYLSGIEKYADRGSYPMPQIILVDLDREPQAALEFLRWLKESPTLRRIPAMIITGVSDSDLIDAAYALGATSCLLKSFDEQVTYDLAKGIGTYASLIATSSAAFGANSIISGATLS